MTRRAILAGLAGVAAPGAEPVAVPLRVILDSRARIPPAVLAGFWQSLWPQMLGAFAAAGVRIDASEGKGEMKRAPSGRPIFTGLSHNAINLVLTDAIPMEWDRAHGLAGVTTQYDGDHLCLVAVPRAHGHRIPFVAVNTLVHELLHVLMGDIFEARPKGLTGRTREARIDWYATRLWLFGDGAEIRRGAAAYMARRGAK